MSAPAQRHRRAVDRGERRAQLVRHGRHEVALHLLDAALLGHVPEGVDGALAEADAGDREPELAAADLERQRLGTRASRRRVRRRSGRARRTPPSPGSPRSPAARRPRAPRARDRRGRRVPDPDEPVAVDEEDAVADELERLRRRARGPPPRGRAARCRARSRRAARAPRASSTSSCVYGALCFERTSVSAPTASPPTTNGTAIELA